MIEGWHNLGTGAMWGIACGLVVIIVGGFFALRGLQKERHSHPGTAADPRDFPGEYCRTCKGEGHVDSPDGSLSWKCPTCEGSGWDPNS